MAGINLKQRREMKKTIWTLAIAALVCCFGFVSCNEVEEEIETPAHEVIFSAATQYENLPETRTVYSGDLVDVSGANRERIDWVAGTDKIKILNANTQEVATYTVGTPAASSEKSVADVTADAAKLAWSNESTNTFYAVYPSTANADAATHTFGAAIPADQSVQNETHTGVNNGGTYTNPVMSQLAYMVAKVENAPSGQNVTLPFYPAMTAFEFNVAFANDGGDAPTITSFDMVSEASALTGNWSWNGSTFTCPARSAGNNDKITVNFTGGRQVTTANPLKFTVFALPQNITQVKLVFHLTSGDKTLSLKQSGAWTVFNACKKYRITTPGLPGDEVWTYVIEEIEDITTYGHDPVGPIAFNVKSYKYSNKAPTVKVPVPWTTQYSANGSSWSGTNGSADFSIASTTGVGVDNSTYSSGEANSASIANSTTGTTTGDAEDATRAALASATPRGTDANPFDLSVHPCYGNKDVTTTRNTANCYIVSAPGVYMFPLVYGNAIKNGTDNVVSYAPESVLGLYQQFKSESHVVYQANFHNAVNDNITSPYILTDLNYYGTVSELNAAIIWEDVPVGAEIIGFEDVEIIGSGQNAFIKFSIDADNIRQGNIVIALRGKVAGILNSNTDILWSWHIWVTEKDLAPVTVYHPLNGTSEMALYNLGWADKTNASSTKWPDRQYYFNIVQTETGGTSESFRVRQIGDAISTPANIGSNCFYQWGRKDPFLTAASQNTNKDCSTGAGYSLQTSNVAINLYQITSSGDPDFGYGIRHPHVMIKNDYTTGWVGGATHVGGTDAQRQNSSIAYNLWSAYVRTQADKTVLGGKAKTVYDPCPPGFTVPSKNAFMAFAGYVGTTEAPNSWQAKKGTAADGGFNFFRNGSSGATIYIPYCGARGYLNTEIYDVTTCGYYWTDCPDISTYAGWGDHNGWRMSKNMVFNTTDGINAHYDLYKGAAYAIRPVLE